MDLFEFDYSLPKGQIAQHPLPRRDASRLLVLHRDTGDLEHRPFSEFPDLLSPDDLLVVNDTKVIPARIFARKTKTRGRVELLLLGSGGGEEWDCLYRGRLRPGQELELEGGGRAVVLSQEPAGAGHARVRFFAPAGSTAWLEAHGHVPLPPYIRRSDEPLDRERYQTPFAQKEGAVAAPTAGLHFSQEILQRVRARGVQLVAITLHVGTGSFRTLRNRRVEDHRLDPEEVTISEEAAGKIEAARGRGARIVAVGTSVVRALEDRASRQGRVVGGVSWADLFIYPGHTFQVVGALLTNFHLPRSSPLLLVSAFAGRENLMQAYQEAVAQAYRFYSYGDAMWIL